jgi:hypothetical protein
VCAQYDRPNGVVFAFQVCAYSIEPSVAHCAFNLLAKDDVRAALRDEIEPDRPEVPFVGSASASAGGAERLAGAGAGPHGPVVGPAGKAQRQRPTAEASKEMALVKPCKVCSSDVCDTSFIHFPLRDVSRGD